MPESGYFLFIAILLALPGVRHGITLKRCVRSLLISVFGVIIPVAVFFLSTFLVPDWKGGCPFGWLDCLHEGKLALTPFVIWGTVSLYAVEFFPELSRNNRVVAVGLFMGALIAGICFLMAIFLGRGPGGFVLGLPIPLYISFWHALRASELVKVQGWRPFPYQVALVGSIPFWIGAVTWSRRVYEKLPDHPPECFVVTAASRGHSPVVGPFVKIVRQGRTVSANHQLLHFWTLEAVWTRSFPRSHKLFRTIYNRCAPTIARRIVSPWAADFIYLMLKPAELLARFISPLLSGWNLCRQHDSKIWKKDYELQ